jgi:pimeloyl-ACP methyl ester carboxylesterase
MSRFRLTTVLALSLALLTVPVRSGATVVAEAVSFQVTNPPEIGPSYTVRGFLYRSSDAPACSTSVMLLLHGLSYGYWAWDFEPGTYGDTYSVARTLAAAGYPAVAIDELGYGASDHPDGYTLTVQSYAAITSQIVSALRAGDYTATAPTSFTHVGLVGHSAGTEISELAAGIFGGIDALVATSYTHFPSQRIVQDFYTGDVVRATRGDYEYFGDTAAQRSEYMYNQDPVDGVADPAVVARDNELAYDTPSGEVFSISNQPSRWAMGAIRVPVLLLLAEKDLLFPVEFGDEELALFVGAADKTLSVASKAGHSFMLHNNAAAANAEIVGWLQARPDAIPAC